MKVIVPNNYWLIKNGFTGIAILQSVSEICFYKNARIHNKKGPARIIYNKSRKTYFYKGFSYGDENNFTNKNWIKYIKESERIRKLSLFK